MFVHGGCYETTAEDDRKNWYGGDYSFDRYGVHGRSSSDDRSILFYRFTDDRGGIGGRVGAGGVSGREYLFLANAIKLVVQVVDYWG